LALQIDSSVEITKATLRVAWRWAASLSIWPPIRCTASRGSSAERWVSWRSTVLISAKMP
jgi:hypothetical protein